MSLISEHPDEAASMPTAHADVDLISRIEAVPTILDVVCKTTGMGFAAVARVTEDRWIACGVRDNIAFGLQPGGELDVRTTICNEIRQHRNAVVISCVSSDPCFRDHPSPASYGFESYISMPIVLTDGSFFGTLCALDPKPLAVNQPEIVRTLKLFADLIAFHLDAHYRLAASQEQLDMSRRDAELREQFIAVLGHDLRNPLASVQAGAQMLNRRNPDANTAVVLGHIQSSVTRMAKLIDDVLDFARGKLGGGLALVMGDATVLSDSLERVANELRIGWPDRTIRTEIAIADAVRCDTSRIEQLFSNLLGNALSHGAAHGPIVARAVTHGKTFELSVSNPGKAIPAETLERLFQPYFRGDSEGRSKGLGLGLYIASEIARAHAGTLSATSNADETRFTFRMPIR